MTEVDTLVKTFEKRFDYDEQKEKNIFKGNK